MVVFVFEFEFYVGVFELLGIDLKLVVFVIIELKSLFVVWFC